MSFNGGTFTITASYLSPSSYIMINGFKGKILTQSNTQIVYKIPPQVNTATQSAFSLQEVTLLSKNLFTYFSDTNSNSNNVYLSFDGSTDTFYNSASAQCWLGVDAGSGMAVTVDRIRLFPNFNWENVGKKILQATIEGSNDMVNWTTIARINVRYYNHKCE